jgi:hypothetical protein
MNVGMMGPTPPTSTRLKMLNQQHDTRIPEFLPLAKVERVVGVAGRHREAPRVAMVVEKREISSTLRHHEFPILEFLNLLAQLFFIYDVGHGD